MLHFRLSILLCFALSVVESAYAAGPGVSPADSEIRQILVNRIDKDKQGVGIVVGVIDAKGRRIVSYGSLEKGDKRPLDGDTLFEIGSITKVFTALLLADMVQRGEVKLDDPIHTRLAPAMKAMLSVKRPTGQPFMDSAMGWAIDTSPASGSARCPNL